MAGRAKPPRALREPHMGAEGTQDTLPLSSYVLYLWKVRGAHQLCTGRGRHEGEGNVPGGEGWLRFANEQSSEDPRAT